MPITHSFRFESFFEKFYAKYIESFNISSFLNLFCNYLSNVSLFASEVFSRMFSANVLTLLKNCFQGLNGQLHWPFSQLFHFENSLVIVLVSLAIMLLRNSPEMSFKISAAGFLDFFFCKILH